MLSKLRDPDGNYTLLTVGIACLILSCFLVRLLRTPLWPLPAGFLVAGVAGCFRWWKQQREDRYDLRRLFDAPPLEEAPMDEELIGPDSESLRDGNPYCGWCDECYPSGTYRCHHCGRALN